MYRKFYWYRSGVTKIMQLALKNIFDESFIVLNGDIITNINLKKMMSKPNSIAAIELRTNYGTMKIKNNKISLGNWRS